MFKQLPTVVKNLLIINVILFLGSQMLGDSADLLASYYPSHYLFRPWQIVTHMFMHADLSHLFFNMFGLYFFGTYLENHWGQRKFLIFYMFCGLGAWFLYELVDGIQFMSILGTAFPDQEWWRIADPKGYANVRGASGAVFGLLMGFAMCFPHVKVQLLFPPIPMKARTMAIVFGGLELFQIWGNSGGNIAHLAHVGGMLFAWILIVYWKKKGQIYY